jgi:hypothetical protein
MKKKIFIWAGISLLAVLLIAVIAVGFFLGGIVKTGMETVGPKITLTTLKVDSVNVSFTGSAGVNGLVLGNPEGYKTDSAIRVGKAAVSVALGSVMGSKIVIHSVEVNAPEITFEGNPFGENNLKKIMDNVNAFAGGGKGATNAPAGSQGKGASKKLEVDHFLISGAKVHVSLTGMGGKQLDLVLPPIEFNNLGTGPDGITAADLTKQVLNQITLDTIKAVGSAVTDLGKDVGKLGKDLGKDANKAVGENVDKLKKGLGGLLGK